MQLIELRCFRNGGEAEAIQVMLLREGIRAFLQGEPREPSESIFGTSVTKARLLVEPADCKKAWDLLDRMEQRYLQKVSCPVCKKHALSIISIKKKHRCKLAALANMILKGKSVEKSFYYKCTSCGYDFKEIHPVEDSIKF
jgi:predicted Zn-ribbon and HTH transcriptional regulator